MHSRRNFLATGIVFCGCCLLDRAARAQATPRQLPVIVSGKRVKTIDVHSHCHIREAAALLGPDGERTLTPAVNGAPEAFIAVEQRLKAMDQQAVDMEVLS